MDRTKRFYDQLAALGSPNCEDDLVDHILRGLGADYRPLQAILRQNYPQPPLMICLDSCCLKNCSFKHFMLLFNHQRLLITHLVNQQWVLFLEGLVGAVVMVLAMADPLTIVLLILQLSPVRIVEVKGISHDNVPAQNSVLTMLNQQPILLLSFSLTSAMGHG